MEINNLTTLSATKDKYHIITSPQKANMIIDQILSNEYAVIGIDIEAAVEMSRFGILCLIQIAYNNSAYIFDMIQMKHEHIKLQELFSRKNIIKVFHDCIEDISLLSNLCNIKEPKGIFDTQIAHRMCYESLNKASNNKNRNSSIALANLIKEYLNIEYEMKGEMHNLMSANPYLWKNRPLTDKLIAYAGNDVIYLPQIYDIINSNCEKRLYPQLTMPIILQECNKYLDYAKINLKIKNFNKTNIPKNTEIQGLIKNYQNYCVYVQLNIGYIGIVQNLQSVGVLKNDFSLGDITMFKVVELDLQRKRYLLESSASYNYENDNENTVSKLAKRLNVCEKSFYPQSYLRMIDGSNNKEEKKEKQVHDMLVLPIRNENDSPLYNIIDNSKIFQK